MNSCSIPAATFKITLQFPLDSRCSSRNSQSEYGTERGAAASLLSSPPVGHGTAHHRLPWTVHQPCSLSPATTRPCFICMQRVSSLKTSFCMEFSAQCQYVRREHMMSDFSAQLCGKASTPRPLRARSRCIPPSSMCRQSSAHARARRLRRLCAPRQTRLLQAARATTAKYATARAVTSGAGAADPSRPGTARPAARVTRRGRQSPPSNAATARRRASARSRLLSAHMSPTSAT